MKFKTLKTAAAISAMFAAGSVNAALVTTWYYDVSLTFDSYTHSGAVTDDIVSSSAGELVWGGDEAGDEYKKETAPGSGVWINNNDPNSFKNQSALTIGDPDRDRGNIDTITGMSDIPEAGNQSALMTNIHPDSYGPGEIGRGNTMTHWNNAISEIPVLTGGSLTDTLKLWDVAPGNPATDAAIYTSTLNIDFAFLETDNDGSCSSLKDDGSAYTLADSAQCPDLFAITNPQIFLNPDNFEYQQTTYFLNVLLFKNGSAVDIRDELLTVAECNELFNTNSNQQCIGFRTLEGEATTYEFAVGVTAVPLPAAAWLFGSALLGFAGLSRRKKATA